MENSIIAFNLDFVEVVSCEYNSNINITCCNIFGNEGGNWTGCIADQANINGNFSANPQFCDTTSGDYHISSASPCVSNNNSCGVIIGALGIGCATEPFVLMEINSFFIFQAYTIEQESIKVYIGDFADGYTSEEINLFTVLVNNTISASSFTLIPTHPYFYGSVLEIYFPLRDFILGYGFLYDTTVQTYTVSGEFNDGTPFSIEGEFTMIGHRSGDANFDGEVDIADLVMFVDYLFNNGPAPDPIEAGDVNRDGQVDIGDLVLMVEIMF